jgi:hypothetical protein
MLPSPPTVTPSTTGPDQFAFYPGSLRHASALFHALQDVSSTGVSYVSLVPGLDGPRYECQQSALIPAAFVSLFPTHLVAATAIGDFLRRMEVFSTAQLIIMPHSAREYPGLGVCLLARIFFPSVNHFRIWLRDFPAGVPITVTPPSGKKETASLCLRGYVEHGPGELVLSAHDSQRVLACEEPEELLCSAMATWCRENLVLESDRHAEDMAFTEKDQQGNLILGLHTSPAVAVLVTQTGLCIFSKGTDQPSTSFMVVLRLRSVLNTASLHSRGQGRQRVDTVRATYELFPAVGGVHQQRAALLAPVQSSQPQALPGLQIVEIVEPESEPFVDAGTTHDCLLPLHAKTDQLVLSQLAPSLLLALSHITFLSEASSTLL